MVPAPKHSKLGTLRQLMPTSPAQRIFMSFAIVILIGTLLLLLPQSNTGVHPGFLRALFTATSATCVTGLVIFDTGSFWSTFGQVVILLLIQVGGLGYMVLTTTLLAAFPMPGFTCARPATSARVSVRPRTAIRAASPVSSHRQ